MSRRSHQMMAATRPMATNSGRQYQRGMIHAHSSIAIGTPQLATSETIAHQWPRRFIGANSLTMAKPVTILAPRPRPAPRRHRDSTAMFGANAPRKVKPPNSSRLIW